MRWTPQYAYTITNDVDKTRAFLQTTGGILALFIT